MGVEMLTVFRWRQFWLCFLMGMLLFFLLLLTLSGIFVPGFVYMGQNAGGLVWAVVKSSPLLIVQTTLNILGIALAVSVCLQCISMALSFGTRLLFGVFFFLACILRLCAIYPAVAANWAVFNAFEPARVLLQQLSSLPLEGSQRRLIEWSPFVLAGVFLCANVYRHVRFFLMQSERFNAVRRGLMVAELDRESRRFAMGGLSFFLSLSGGLLLLSQLTSSFKISISAEDSGQFRPHVFVFAIDSLRVDRLASPEFAQVMPFVRSKLVDSALFKPMLVGVPRTFPSWVEIATCQYAHRTGVRTMFPDRAPRMQVQQTLFQSAREAGYETVFLSDFAGDIFPRFPFGASQVHAPISNLRSLIENATLQNFSALQAVLMHPKLHRVLPAVLESAEFADPRLLALELAHAVDQNASGGRPLFMTTFFSTAHFPYAAPGPWFARFQEAGKASHLVFKKDTDQKIITSGSPLGATSGVPSVAQTVALYNGALRSVDDSIRDLWEELEAKGWLSNSVIVIMGDHGENLYESARGMGHGDGVGGEYATVTPLVIWTQGRAEAPIPEAFDGRLVRSVDVAPTLARRLGLGFDASRCDGQSLLDVAEKKPDFPLNQAYQESGLWFSAGKTSPEGQARIQYPAVTGLLEIDPGLDFEFILQSNLSPTVSSVKERAWVNEKFRLVARTTRDGISLSLFDREHDMASVTDLLLQPQDTQKHQAVALEMLRQLNEYLASRGVEVVKNAEGRFFYAENVLR